MQKSENSKSKSQNRRQMPQSFLVFIRSCSILASYRVSRRKKKISNQFHGVVEIGKFEQKFTISRNSNELIKIFTPINHNKTWHELINDESGKSNRSSIAINWQFFINPFHPLFIYSMLGSKESTTGTSVRRSMLLGS